VVVDILQTWLVPEKVFAFSLDLAIGVAVQAERHMPKYILIGPDPNWLVNV
jgi:hypothetical protein